MTRWMDKLIDLTRSISRYATWAAGALMLCAVLLVSAEIILRKLGSGLVHGATELGGYMLAICSAWAFSFTLLSKANIRFDAFYTGARRPIRAVMDVFGLFCMTLFVSIVGYFALDTLVSSFEMGAKSAGSLRVQLWIPQLVWTAGFGFLVWTSALLLLRCIVALLQGDYGRVRRLAGLGGEEEVEREIAQGVRDMAMEAHGTQEKDA